MKVLKAYFKSLPLFAWNNYGYVLHINEMFYCFPTATSLHIVMLYIISHAQPETWIKLD